MLCDDGRGRLLDDSILIPVLIPAHLPDAGVFFLLYLIAFSNKIKNNLIFFPSNLFELIDRFL